MPTCRDMTELATDYMERALPPRVRLGATWHLALCRMCRAYYGQVRRTRDLLASGIPTPPPPELEANMLRALAGRSATPD